MNSHQRDEQARKDMATMQGFLDSANALIQQGKADNAFYNMGFNMGFPDFFHGFHKIAQEIINECYQRRPALKADSPNPIDIAVFSCILLHSVYQCGAVSDTRRGISIPPEIAKRLSTKWQIENARQAVNQAIIQAKKKRKLGRVEFFSSPEMTSIFEMAAANFYQKNPDIKDKPFNPDVIKTMQAVKKDRLRRN